MGQRWSASKKAHSIPLPLIPFDSTTTGAGRSEIKSDFAKSSEDGRKDLRALWLHLPDESTIVSSGSSPDVNDSSGSSPVESHPLSVTDTSRLSSPECRQGQKESSIRH